MGVTSLTRRRRGEAPAAATGSRDVGADVRPTGSRDRAACRTKRERTGRRKEGTGCRQRGEGEGRKSPYQGTGTSRMPVINWVTCHVIPVPGVSAPRAGSN